MPYSETFQCKVGVFTFKHLGLQIGGNMNVIKAWEPVVYVFTKCFLIWKAKNFILWLGHSNKIASKIIVDLLLFLVSCTGRGPRKSGLI